MKDKNPVSSALFGVAAIQAVVVAIGWFIYSPSFAPTDWVITFSPVIFIALGILARWTRTLAALIAVALYGFFLILQASVDIELLTTGLVFKVPNVILLLAALFLAMRGGRKDNKAATGDAGLE